MIYLDNAATTLMYPEVRDTVSYYEKYFYNPSSPYSASKKIRKELEKARTKLADMINAQPEEIYFTSGGTESDNWACNHAKAKRGHIITTAIEHKAVLMPLNDYNNKTIIKPMPDGAVNVSAIEQAIKRDTVMISVMTANNETGTLQPVDEIGRLAKEYNIIFHTDAVQAFGHIKIDVKKIGADMLSASSHKFHGPKGCGFLYADKNTGIKPFIYGGGQERGQRSGTENVPGILGMVKAAEILHRIMDENNRKLRKINDYMTDRILNEIDDCICNGNRENRLSNNINVSFGNIDGKALLVLLDMEGVYVSGASACNGGKEKSYVLSSLGVPEKYADGTIRMTMDYTMNMKQADYVLNVLKKCVNYLRKK